MTMRHFRRVPTVAEGAYYLCHARLFVRLFVRPSVRGRNSLKFDIGFEETQVRLKYENYRALYIVT
jgi:hypothetical protein